MAEIIALLFMALAAAFGMAYAINFFWRVGLKKSFAYAAFFISVIMIFCLSGLWEDSARHSWGILTPLFAAMLCAAYFGVKIGRKLWQKLRDIYKN